MAEMNDIAKAPEPVAPPPPKPMEPAAPKPTTHEAPKPITPASPFKPTTGFSSGPPSPSSLFKGGPASNMHKTFEPPKPSELKSDTSPKEASRAARDAVRATSNRDVGEKAIKDFASGASKFGSGIMSGIDKVSSSATKAIGSGLSNFGKGAFNVASETVGATISGVNSASKGIDSTIKGAQKFGDDVVKGAQKFGNDVVKGVDNIGKGIAKGANDFMNTTPNQKLDGARVALDSAGKSMSNAFNSVASSPAGKIAAGIGLTMTAPLTGSLGLVAGTGAIASGIKDSAMRSEARLSGASASAIVNAAGTGAAAAAGSIGSMIKTAKMETMTPGEKNLYEFKQNQKIAKEEYNNTMREARKDAYQKFPGDSNAARLERNKIMEKTKFETAKNLDMKAMKIGTNTPKINAAPVKPSIPFAPKLPASGAMKGAIAGANAGIAASKLPGAKNITPPQKPVPTANAVPTKKMDDYSESNVFTEPSKDTASSAGNKNGAQPIKQAPPPIPPKQAPPKPSNMPINKKV